MDNHKDLSPRVNFINLKRTNFTYERLFSSYIWALNELSYKKRAQKTLMKLSPALQLSLSLIEQFKKLVSSNKFALEKSAKLASTCITNAFFRVAFCKNYSVRLRLISKVGHSLWMNKLWNALFVQGMVQGLLQGLRSTCLLVWLVWSTSFSQFHQRYTRTFFVQIFWQSQNVTRKSCQNNIRTKNLYVKHWWNLAGSVMLPNPVWMNKVRNALF